MTTATTPTKPWDLSLALEFSNSFSPPKADLPSSPLLGDNAIFHFDEETFKPFNGKSQSTTNNDVGTADLAKHPTTLGDFARVFQFLGAPSIDPESSDSLGANHFAYGLSKEKDYASDGSTYKHMPELSHHNNQLSDATEGFSDEPGTPPSTATPLTKTQRKKARRKIRRLEEQQKKDTTASESEADPVDKIATPNVASTHYAIEKKAALNNTGADANMRQQPASSPKAKLSTQSKSPMGDPATVKQAANAVAQALAGIKQVDAPNTPSPKPRSIPPRQHTIRPMVPFSQLSLRSVPAVPSGLQGQHTNIHRPAASNLLPSSITPMANGYTSAIGIANGSPATGSNNPSGPQPATAMLPANARTPKPKPFIAPRIARSRADRDWALLNKIIVDHPQDRKYLLSPMNLTTHSNDPYGIHVFVDASNIFIGFNDRLKASRNIHLSVHLPTADMSFDSLALIMERRRPVAKRALAGSTPHVPAFDKAKAVGYECSILEKVYKARQITERQQYFNQIPHLNHGRSPRVAPPCNAVNLSAGPAASKAADGNGSGSGSGSETNTPQYAPPAMVEQCVDEILHLKMMESIVDYETPSTLVLATGDAAAAEYSGGFQRMAQRALMKGWTVELVTWRKGLNGRYVHYEWTRTWGEKFKIIYLDDYAEELLDMDAEEDESI